MTSRESLTSMSKTALGMARVRAEESRRPDRLFELDLPEVLAFKQQVLAAQHAVPRCQRVVLPADLRQDWPATLTAAGLQPTQPTAWLAEDLLEVLLRHQMRRPPRVVPCWMTQGPPATRDGEG